MPPYDTTPPGYGQGFGTSDPRDQITQALMNVRYPPPSMMPAGMQQFGMPTAGMGPMPQAPMAGTGPGIPAAASPQGGMGMQQPGMVAAGPQPGLQPPGY